MLLDPALVRLVTDRRHFQLTLHIRDSFPRSIASLPSRTERFSCPHQSIYLEFEQAILQRLGVMSYAPGTAAVRLPGPGCAPELAAELQPALRGLVRQIDPQAVLLDQSELGDGAFGKVIQALDASQGGLHVAVKCVRPSLPKKEKRLFQDEVLMHTRLTHPNLVTYLYCIAWESSLYLVLNYCDGGTLWDLCKHCSVGENDGAYFIREALKGLRFLHERDVLHRDIKPENILISSSGRVQIADFGLAIDVAGGRTLTSHAGTLGYMCPEMLRHERYGKPADVFSLGTVMYRLLYSQALFSYGNHLFRLFHMAFDASIAPFPLVHSRSKPRLSASATDVLSRMLQHRPENRPSAEQLLEHPFWENASQPNDLRNLIDISVSSRSLEAMGF